MSKKKKRFSGWNLLWIVPLALILAVAVLMYVVPAFEGVGGRSVEGASDWMQALPDDTPLSEVVLPGTHDSATQYVQLAFFSKCQALSIRGQLDAGYRYLDIRLGDGEGMPLMHGFAHCVTGGWPWSGSLYLKSVLDDCYAFLAENPSEAVVFCVKHEHGDASEAEFAKQLAAFVNEKPELWYSGDTIPTVGEARGKLVLLKRFEDKDAVLPGIEFIWPDQDGYDDPTLNTKAYSNPAVTAHVQDRFCYDVSEKWAAFTEGMKAGEVSLQDVSLNFLSTKGHAKYGHPYSFAVPLNEKLKALSASELRGWVIVDFGSAELAEKIYTANFN